MQSKLCRGRPRMEPPTHGARLNGEATSPAKGLSYIDALEKVVLQKGFQKLSCERAFCSQRAKRDK